MLWPFLDQPAFCSSKLNIRGSKHRDKHVQGGGHGQCQQQASDVLLRLQAYQVLRKGGLDDDHIVVMMADDLAQNYLNPHPGKLFNKPGGEDVYEGVPLVRHLGFGPPFLNWCTWRGTFPDLVLWVFGTLRSISWAA